MVEQLTEAHVVWVFMILSSWAKIVFLAQSETFDSLATNNETNSSEQPKRNETKLDLSPRVWFAKEDLSLALRFALVWLGSCDSLCCAKVKRIEIKIDFRHKSLVCCCCAIVRSDIGSRHESCAELAREYASKACNERNEL